MKKKKHFFSVRDEVWRENPLDFLTQPLTGKLHYEIAHSNPSVTGTNAIKRI